MTTNKPTLYPHQAELIEQIKVKPTRQLDPNGHIGRGLRELGETPVILDYAGTITPATVSHESGHDAPIDINAELEQYAKRQAYQRADILHEIKHRQSGKTVIVGLAATSLATATGRIANQHPEMQYLDNPLIEGYDLGGDEIAFNADWSEVEARFNAYAGEPYPYVQQLGRAKRPMEERTNDRIPVEDARSIYTSHFNEQSPKGRHGANNGKAEKALAKRRAANKVARKARRK